MSRHGLNPRPSGRGARQDDYDGWDCHHQNCFNCGGCGCPGYCDDHQTYNLRPGETGGTDDD